MLANWVNLTIALTLGYAVGACFAGVRILASPPALLLPPLRTPPHDCHHHLTPARPCDQPRHHHHAGEIAPAAALPSLATLFSLTAGFLVNARTMPPVWAWLHWLAYEQWIFSALMVNQFSGQQYTDYCNGGNSTNFLSSLGNLIPKQYQQQAGARRGQRASGPSTSRFAAPLNQPHITIGHAPPPLPRGAPRRTHHHRRDLYFGGPPPLQVEGLEQTFAPLLSSFPGGLDPAAAGISSCVPMLGDDVLDQFDLKGRDRWQSLGYAVVRSSHAQRPPPQQDDLSSATSRPATRWYMRRVAARSPAQPILIKTSHHLPAPRAAHRTTGLATGARVCLLPRRAHGAPRETVTAGIVQNAPSCRFADNK